MHPTQASNPYLALPDATAAALAALYDNNSTPRNQRDLAALRARSAQAFAAAGPRHVAHRWSEGADGVADVFLPSEGAAPVPVLVFVHGGRWRINTSRETAFWAPALVGAGCACVVLNFPQLPAVSLRAMAAAVRAGVAAMLAAAPALGLDPRRAMLAGHSSGAHLALAAALGPGPGGTVQAAPWLSDLRALLLLGGMYDLRPLVRTAPAEVLSFDAEEAEAMSPVLALSRAPALAGLPPVLVGVGEEESPEFLRQARALHWALARLTHAEWHVVPGAAHFDAALAFDRPDARLQSFVRAQLLSAETGR